jgi:hypothetical protein
MKKATSFSEKSKAFLAALFPANSATSNIAASENIAENDTIIYPNLDKNQ